MSTGTASLVKDNLRKFNGHAALYLLDPPLEGHAFVIASAIDIGKQFSKLSPSLSGTEVYLFPGDSGGHVIDWGELPGSMKGTLDHADALREAGYEINP